MDLEQYNKTFTFTQEQYEGTKMVYDVVGRVLAEASPEDETPLAVSVMEILSLIGREVMSRVGGKSSSPQAPAQPKK